MLSTSATTLISLQRRKQNRNDLIPRQRVSPAIVVETKEGSSFRMAHNRTGILVCCCAATRSMRGMAALARALRCDAGVPRFWLPKLNAVGLAGTSRITAELVSAINRLPCGSRANCLWAIQLRTGGQTAVAAGSVNAELEISKCGTNGIAQAAFFRQYLTSVRVFVALRGPLPDPRLSSAWLSYLLES